MRLIMLTLSALCAGVTGCATTAPRPTSSEVALIAWSRPDAGCDFENPVREGALAITTDRTEAAVVSVRSDEASSATYMVRNAQILYRPTAGDRFCLAVLRGPTLGHKDAVFGFDARFLDGFRAEIAPAYSRLDQPLFSRRGAGDANVNIAFVTGLKLGSERRRIANVSFDLGPVGSNASPRSGAPVILELPEPGSQETTELAAIIREAGRGQSSVIPADLIDRALTESTRWD